MADRSAADIGPGTLSGELAGATITATVRYFAAARAAAGVMQESVRIPVPTGSGRGGCTIGLLLDVLIARHGGELARVLPRCSYLLDEVAVHGTGTMLSDGQVLDVLPPFAGG